MRQEVTPNGVGHLDNCRQSRGRRDEFDASAHRLAERTRYVDVEDLAGERVDKAFASVGHRLDVTGAAGVRRDASDGATEFFGRRRAPELVHGDQHASCVVGHCTPIIDFGRVEISTEATLASTDGGRSRRPRCSARTLRASLTEPRVTRERRGHRNAGNLT